MIKSSLPRTVALLCLVSLLSQAGLAALIPELSDDFEDGDYTADKEWALITGSWYVQPLDSYVLRAIGGSQSHILYLANGTDDRFGSDYEFMVEYRTAIYNKTAFNGGDFVGLSIGNGTGPSGVCGGYSWSIGIGGGGGSPPGETNNWCWVYMDRSNGACAYTGVVYINYTWFNDTGRQCQEAPLDVVVARSDAGDMTMSIDGELVFNVSETTYKSDSWNVVVAVTGYNSGLGYMNAWLDDINVYNTTSPECAVNWSVWLVNDSCNITDSLSERYYSSDSAGCGLPPAQPNGTIVANHSCNYCLASISSVFLNESACISGSKQRSYEFVDSAFSSCCNVTNITSDCIFLNGSYAPYSINVSCSVTELRTGICPDTTPSVLVLALVFVIVAFMTAFGFWSGVTIIALFSSFGWFALSWVLAGCSPIIGLLCLCFGLLVMIASALRFWSKGAIGEGRG